MPQIIKDYRHDPALREAFYRHTQRVFPRWQEHGHWSEDYMPHSILEGEQMIANASVTRMKLWLEGNPIRGLQIGTVGTLPEFRNRGLARLLMEHVMDTYAAQAELIFLFTNETVLDFYPKFGFRPVREVVFVATENLPVPQYQARKLDISREQDMALVGNPVMHHLALGLDPAELGQAPFALTRAGALDLAATELGFRGLAPGARAYFLPCIAGHVGADAAAVALAEAPHEADALTLVVDVGTNAEILLGNRQRLLACSSPTGPAFEGAQISAGQRAAPGAIERVRIDREFRVIGCDLWSNEPGFSAAVQASGITGICGSGIIEAVAEMRMAGLVDGTGLIGSAEQTGSARGQLRGRTHVWLLHDGTAAGGPRIAITQEDIRAIQLAKAALYAGARLLMDELGVDHVDRVVLAGAFGAHISPLHAMVLGMIPDVPLDAVTAAGNAAGTGARIALCNRAARREVERLTRLIHKVETAIEPRFQEHFLAASDLPHATAPFDRLRAVAPLPDASFRPGGARRRRRGGGV